MFGGYALVLILMASMIFIRAIVTFGNSDDDEQVGRKLATNNPAGFISIDCGAAGDRYDETTGLIYESDKEFIDTGINMPISALLIYTEVRQELKDLRSFPQGAKNCYTLKPKPGKNNIYLIRAYFSYGNYDGKSEYPKFDLYLGVNKWDTIDSSQDGYKEIIFFSLTDIIFVCLVNTGDGVPFISALELRLLNSSIYRTGSDALSTLMRYDVGGLSSHRYPDDIYDRIWDIDPLDSYNYNQINTLSTIDTQSSNDAYYPPAAVLRTAAEAENFSTPLTFSCNPINLDTTTRCYVYLHFAEIENLGSGQLRKLNISFNEEYFLAKPVQLEYLIPLTVGPPTLPIMTTQFTFSIYGTKDSNLPPILNGFEMFEQKMLSASPTNIEDVDAILDIKQVYGVTRNWQGDPCVPIAYSWDGLNCSYENPPRIISLNLASSGLTGEIASSLSNLKSIEFLDLSNNDLRGPVPEFLAQLPSLRTLNLTGNKLSGSIPQAMMEKFKNGSLHLSADENPNLCATNSCLAKKKNKVGVLVACIVLVLLLFLLIALGIIWYYRRGRPAGSLKSKNQVFTYSTLKSITDNFSSSKFIGRGGFGEVYLGTLENGNQVAVKVLSPKAWDGQTQFQNEVQLLTRVHHKSLVSLLGYCNEVKHKALVYEYMVNGNLRQHLSEEANANGSIWLQRLQIAIDAAQGLKYLHDDCKPPIIHRDIKTSNILLNEKCQAKITDFGLARDFKNEGGTLESAVPVGTEGYMDPEYEKNNKFSKKSDVYSFGIVLFELITGHPAVLKDGVNSIHIPEWVKLRQGIKSIVDTKFGEYLNIDSAMKAVEIAWSCVQPTAEQRPDMNRVVAELEDCLKIESGGSRNNSGQEDREQHDKDQAVHLKFLELETSKLKGHPLLGNEPKSSLVELKQYIKFFVMFAVIFSVIVKLAECINFVGEVSRYSRYLRMI